MSSDVYIDLSKNPTYATDPGGDPNCEIIRIGHLGEMAYYGYNMFDALHYFQDAEPTIQRHLLVMLDRLAKRFQDYRKKESQNSDDYFCVRWGYHKPDPWEDVPEPGEFEEEFASFIGWHWAVRVD